MIQQVIKFWKLCLELHFRLLKLACLLLRSKLKVLELLVGASHNLHLQFYLILELLFGKHVAIIQVIIQFLFRSISHQSIAATNVEVDIRQRIQTKIIESWIYFHYRHHFQEQAQLGNLYSLFHDINAIEVAENDTLIDKVLNVTAILLANLFKFSYE